MNLFFSKKGISIRAISFLVLSSLTFSLYPLGPSEGGPRENANSEINKELQKKLDILRVEQVLDSVNSLQCLKESDAIIEDNEWEELEIDTILENWQKYAKTKFDMWGIKKLLRHAPKGSKEIIHTLVESGSAFKELDKIIDIVKNAQDAIMDYWDEHNILHYDAEGLYYSLFERIAPKANNFLNDSAVALEASQALGIANPAIGLLASLGVVGVVSGFLSSKIFGFPFSWKKSFMRGLTRPLRDHDPRPMVYKNGYDYFRLYEMGNITLGDDYLISKNFIKRLLSNVSNSEKAKSIVAGALSVAFVGGMRAWGDYKTYKGLKGEVSEIIFLHKTSGKLQNNLVKIAHVLRALGSLENTDLCDSVDNTIAIKNIQRYVDRRGVSENLERLFSLLHSSTFTSESSFWYSRGCLLKTHRLFAKIKNELVPLLQNIALLGGYRAIAQMVRAHKNSRLRFCFVEGVGNFGSVSSDDAKCRFSNGPSVNMTCAWVPLISEDKVVTNNVALGCQGGPLSAVVTGPNGGGKSTFMITVAFNVLLSKLGIAAAEKACISDFAKIRTSLRPQQDIKSGLSAFMAEHKRVDQVKKSINSCDGNILVLLDEPYKGTVEVESACRVYKFGKEVAAHNPNCMLMLATHLRKPIELDQGTNGVFGNYQMGYIETKSGVFKRTFRVEPGPAIWWFDDAHRRARFIDWLCAQEI
ncbi:hypothetical protein ACFLYU_01235 [Candidatus Dependentiae bacterium]